jgi:hypothetical protein
MAAQEGVKQAAPLQIALSQSIAASARPCCREGAFTWVVCVDDGLAVQLLMVLVLMRCRHVSCLQGSLPEGSAAPCVVINGKAVTFNFALDALEVVAQLTPDFIPALPNDKVSCPTATCRVWALTSLGSVWALATGSCTICHRSMC